MRVKMTKKKKVVKKRKNKDKMIKFRCSKEFLKKLRYQADLHDVTMADFIRFKLRKYLD